jgi:hypothetical protein
MCLTSKLASQTPPRMNSRLTRMGRVKPGVRSQKSEGDKEKERATQLASQARHKLGAQMELFARAKRGARMDANWEANRALSLIQGGKVAKQIGAEGQ